MSATAPARSFIPEGIDLADFGRIEPLYRELLERPIESVGALEKWLADLSELSAAVDEYGSRRYIDKSCHTDDVAMEKAFLHFVEEIEPKVKPLFFELQKRFLSSPHQQELKEKRYAMLRRKWQADVELFRPENIPLETEATKKVTDYDKLCGAMTIMFRGQEHTMQQAARFLEEPDRGTRQEVWQLIAGRRLEDRQKIEELFDELLGLRRKMASNAGLSDYRAFAWKSYKRFDYTPEECLRFAEAVERTCVPLMRELDRERREELKLERLRPWDLAVDVRNRPPLRPFGGDEVERFIDKTRGIFERLSPELAEEFESLRRNRNLDLQSRKGKQPGGYQCSLEASRQPFIFMNAAGLQGDVETLLHEGGHAFHHLAACRQEPLVFLRSAPMEFCEVASMSMELLGSEQFGLFYADAADAGRAKRKKFEEILGLLPWIATIDSFQHWLYTHPEHTRQQRIDQWLTLMRRFGRELDWGGQELARQYQWQRQLHLFHAPFYYIEYGIAQLGALQIWMKSRHDPRKALANYRSALGLGGSRSLPELFAAAGIEFDFSERTLGPLMQAVGEELGSLPR